MLNLKFEIQAFVISLTYAKWKALLKNFIIKATRRVLKKYNFSVDDALADQIMYVLFMGVWCSFPLIDIYYTDKVTAI